MQPRSRTRKFAYLVLAVIALTSIYRLFMSLSEWRSDVIVFSPPEQNQGSFGSAIAANQETVMVGVPDSREEKAGAVNIYHRLAEGWQLETRLTEPGFRFNGEERFAQFIAVDENRIAVSGDAHSLSEYDSVYIFDKQSKGWIQQAKLTPPPAPKTQIFPNRFTDHIGLDQNTLVVGNYVYSRNTVTNVWEYETQLRLPEELVRRDGICSTGDMFTVAISGDTIVLGNKSHGPRQAGRCANVFVRNPTTRQWTHQALLRPDICQSPLPCRPEACETTCERAGGFGHSVAIDGNTIVIGTSTELSGPFVYCDSNGSDAAYIFERTPGTENWRQAATLYPKGLFERFQASRCGFGDAVAIKGDFAVVTGVNFRAAPHLFRRDSKTGQWHYQARLLYSPSKVYRSSYYYPVARSLALSKRYVVIGDTGLSKDKQSSRHPGAFYLFDLQDNQFTQ